MALVSQRSISYVLGGGALAFGVLGLVDPARLARMMAGDEETARAIGFRDVGNAIAIFATGGGRPAIVQRMLFDVGDAVMFGPRKPKVAVGALAFAALGGVALAAGRR